MRLLFSRKVRGIDDHIYKKLRIIRRCKAAERYEIVVCGTRKLLRCSCLSADLISGNTSRFSGPFLVIDGHEQCMTDKFAGGLGYRLPNQVRLDLSDD